MSVEMAIWRLGASGPDPLAFAPLERESRLEEMIEADPTLIGADLLVLGRQVVTPYGGRIDILAIDAEARLHVLELKRDRTPREVVAQLLDYGSWVQGLTPSDIAEIYAESARVDFEKDFFDRFGYALPDAVNVEQQLTIVAGALDPSSDRIVEYLAERYGVPINAVFFRHFRDGDREYLARTWLIAPEDAAVQTSRGRKLRPWNGRDFYVVLGSADDDADRWRLARAHGVLNAGGGEWYWKPLRNLTVGSRVFA